MVATWVMVEVEVAVVPVVRVKILQEAVLMVAVVLEEQIVFQDLL